MRESERYCIYYVVYVLYNTADATLEDLGALRENVIIFP